MVLDCIEDCLYGSRGLLNQTPRLYRGLDQRPRLYRGRDQTPRLYRGLDQTPRLYRGIEDYLWVEVD